MLFQSRPAKMGILKGCKLGLLPLALCELHLCYRSFQLFGEINWNYLAVFNFSLQPAEYATILMIFFFEMSHSRFFWNYWVFAFFLQITNLNFFDQQIFANFCSHSTKDESCNDWSSALRLPVVLRLKKHKRHFPTDFNVFALSSLRWRRCWLEHSSTRGVKRLGGSWGGRRWGWRPLPHPQPHRGRGSHRIVCVAWLHCGERRRPWDGERRSPGEMFIFSGVHPDILVSETKDISVGAAHCRRWGLHPKQQGGPA